MDNETVVFNYGGGRQTIAMSILIAKGILPRPDIIVMADTSRENQMTWDYYDNYVGPLFDSLGLELEIASHGLATVDLYALNGDILLPAFTTDGKLPGFCSNEWKRRVVDRHLRAKGVKGGIRWLGLALDEKQRWRRHHNIKDGKWTTVCPLVDLMLNTDSCLTIVEKYGWPQPQTSSCWMCPHKQNSQWRHIRDHHPEDFEKAIEIDKEIRDHDPREESEQGGELFLHHSRTPLSEADLDIDDKNQQHRQCSLGMCFI